MTRIVPCAPVHCRVVAALHSQCFDQAWGEDAVAEVLSMPGAFGFLACEGERPTGFLLCRRAADEGEVLSMGVAPGERRRGLGRRLLEAALEAAAAADVRALYLEVGKDNRAARALYQKQGFSAVGKRKNYYQRLSRPGVDALILVRRIGPPPKS